MLRRDVVDDRGRQIGVRDKEIRACNVRRADRTQQIDGIVAPDQSALHAACVEGRGEFVDTRLYVAAGEAVGPARHEGSVGVHMEAQTAFVHLT